MPGGLGRQARLPIMLNAEEMAAVDDFRFKNRMPSRAAAVRELMRRGLSAEGFSLAARGEKSASFGVLGNKATRPHGGKGVRGREAKAKDDEESKPPPGDSQSRR
jgi:hypothetical protein